MAILILAAFSDGSTGGNPAGVVIGDALPAATEMQKIANDVGFSETAFAAPDGQSWRVRFFSPESEVPFCGHATIALGAALALQKGDAVYDLKLNDAEITVEGRHDGNTIAASLQSPPTRSKPLSKETVEAVLELFGLSNNDLDPRIPPAFAEAGATHIILAVASRAMVAEMAYDFDKGQQFMRDHNLVTIALVHAETANRFNVRNAFASGGVYEDPATGAAAAALSGYLRDLNWPTGGSVHIIQGEDMGARSLLHAEFSETPGTSIWVSGDARIIE